MPRTHKHALGARCYKDYSNEKLEECLREVKRGALTQRAAAEVFNIPRSTIKNKLAGKHSKPVGRPPVLSYGEERLILQRVQLLCDYGFPATPQDVRHLIKSYLDTKNRTVLQFNDNLPSSDYMSFFLERHKDFTKRLTSNVKRARAEVDESVLREYINNLTSELEEIPPSNIRNFDETCLVNDPGKLQCIVKRGTRYPERVVNYSKAGVFIMYCGNAEGELLPPYCLYKSTSVIMDSWIRGAPPGTKLNRSKSGWFDEGLFESFFNDLLLPKLKKQEGIHAIIGDNLLSHFSESVIRKCQKYQIKFICLPPNSTHLTQPLDVAFFKPFKVIWRKILNDFCKTKVGVKEESIPKDIFPQLLSKLMKALKEGKSKENLVAGFKKCGIVPIDMNQLLGRIPISNQPAQENDAAAVDHSLIKILSELCSPGPKRQKKSKRVKVVPGKSVTAKDFEEKDQPFDVPGSSGKTSKKLSLSGKTRKSSKKRKDFTSSESDDEGSSAIEYASSDLDLEEFLSEKEDEENRMPTEKTASVKSATQKVLPGRCVKIVKGLFTGFYATVMGRSYGDEWEINYFRKQFGKWVISVNDLDSREAEDMIVVTGHPDNRGHYTFED